MKKYLFGLLAIMMVAMVSVSFTSCSKDDSDSDTLVGTWKYSFGSNSYVILTFYEDGTGLYKEFDHGEWEEMGESFIYTREGNTLTFHNTMNYNKTETGTIVSLTKDKLVLRNWPDHGDCTFYRQ